MLQDSREQVLYSAVKSSLEFRVLDLDLEPGMALLVNSKPNVAQQNRLTRVNAMSVRHFLTDSPSSASAMRRDTIQWAIFLLYQTTTRYNLLSEILKQAHKHSDNHYLMVVD